MNSSKNLLITLGHNSSAILIENDKIICGYEEERLSKVKSDSGFPRLAIMQCLNYQYCDKLDTIYISYWNNDFSIFDDNVITNDKHYDKKFLKTLCKQYNCNIQYLTEDFTHHDAHAYGALNFFENHATDDELNDDFYVIVSDGFGNKEEVTTIYKRENDKLVQVNKIWDYFSSVGLMYQYATSFCDMKENEDEYKFLGYESHIKEVLSEEDIDKLYLYSKVFIEEYIKNAINRQPGLYIADTYIDITKLKAVKAFWNKEFNDFLEVMNFKKEEHNIEQVRCVIAAFIQNNIEQFIGYFLKKYNIKNVILSGGIFYNVKLNNYIMNNISGKICVYPLAGDQGAALGMYRKYYGKFDFKSLLIGKRDLNPTPVETTLINSLHNFEVFNNKTKFINRISELLNSNKIVNIMTGAMEFGPRALGSTTTMAKPTKENVHYINILNERNEAMPMAPQILESKARKYFGDQIDKIIGSNFYMIITMNQNKTPDESYMGISHKYPLVDIYSSRCQIVHDNDEIYTKYVLQQTSDDSDFKINTSCNYHGTPILYSVKDMIKNHIKTGKNDKENRSYSLIGIFN